MRSWANPQAVSPNPVQTALLARAAGRITEFPLIGLLHVRNEALSSPCVPRPLFTLLRDSPVTARLCTWMPRPSSTSLTALFSHLRNRRNQKGGGHAPTSQPPAHQPCPGCSTSFLLGGRNAPAAHATLPTCSWAQSPPCFLAGT